MMEHMISIYHHPLKKSPHYYIALQSFCVDYFSMPPDHWKIGKKQHFICSNLTLFIVPLFLFFSVFSFFLFFLFFFLFFLFFSFSLGGGDGPPAPLKWHICPSFHISGCTRAIRKISASISTLSRLGIPIKLSSKHWIELNWIELNWIELNWIELNLFCFTTKNRT